MKEKSLFRTNVFGAYNKQDVDDYVKRLEDELIRVRRGAERNDDREVYQQETAREDKSDIMILEEDHRMDYREKERAWKQDEPVREESYRYKKAMEEEKPPVREIMEELKSYKRESEDYEEDYKAVKDMLLNVRADAELITAKAREKARLIVENAQKQIMDTHKETFRILARCLEDNQKSLAASKRYLEEQIKKVERAQQEISVLEESMKRFLEEYDQEAGSELTERNPK